MPIVASFIDFSHVPVVARTEETKLLQSAFDLMCKEKRSGVALVHGESGSGKSLLVQHSLKSRKAHWCSGKFEQHKISCRCQPYSAIVEALSELCDAYINNEHVKHELECKLGELSGAILPGIIPGVAKLIKWSDSNESTLSSTFSLVQEDRNFQRVKKELRIFFNVVCSQTTPCIIFIDDLQWADRESLELLRSIISTNPIEGLFFCGAFRDNEIDSTFPFIAELRENNTNTIMIHAKDLSIESINELISSILDRKDPAETMELSEVVAKKTQGNAFHVVQFLRSLQDNGFLHYSLLNQRFEWNLANIQSETDVSENVASLMKRTMERLPIETREILKVAACLGSRFDIQILEQVIDGSSDVGAQIQVAIDEGLVDQRRRSSRFKFSHDQIHHAAYSQVGEGHERIRTHLHIGRVLKTKLEQGENYILFVATEQLNQGSSLITDDKEKIELAFLNLKAAQSSCERSAFSVASMFLQAGLSLVDEQMKWTKYYDFTLQSMTLLSEMEYCVGNRDVSRLHVDEVLQNCKTLDEMLPVYIIKMESLAAQGFDIQAIKVGTDTLRLLGESIPKKPNLCNVLIEYARTKRLLRGKSDDELLTSHELTSSRKLMSLKIMSLLGGYAYTACQPLLIALLGLQEMKIILRFGLSKYSAESFATFGILAGQMGDFQLAFRYGNLAATLAANYSSRYHRARSLLAVHFFLWHLRRPAHESIEPLLKAHRYSMEIGDIRNAAFSFFSYIYCYVSCGLPLGPVVQDTKRFRMELIDHSQDLMYRLTSIAYQTLLNLIGGDSDDPLKLTGTAMDEDIVLQEATEANSTIVAQNVYLQKAILGNYFGDFKLAGAMTEIMWQPKYQVGEGCNFTTGVTYFVLGLSALGMRRVSGTTRWQKHRSRRYSRKYIARLKRWVRQGEPNILHMYLILVAEEAALKKGKLHDVKNAYDTAITSAVRSGFLQNAALAEERCALFFLQVGDHDYADDYLRRSYAHYEEWGSVAKLRQLEETYDFLNSPQPFRTKVSTFRLGKERYSSKASEMHKDMSPRDMEFPKDSSTDSLD